MKRELKQTTINGQVYLFPVPVVLERKYLILCASQAEATRVSAAVSEGRLTHPDLVSDDFQYLTLHTDKRTKIYTPNLKMLVY